MDNVVISQAESDEKILTFDVPDEALERAASAEQNASQCSTALTTGIAAVCRRL
jgi:hypothetical protein